jgi:integrase/recombinase XerC
MTTANTCPNPHRTPRTEAFRQFQCPTVPLCVSSDFRTRTLRRALDDTLAAALNPKKKRQGR